MQHIYIIMLHHWCKIHEFSTNASCSTERMSIKRKILSVLKTNGAVTMMTSLLGKVDQIAKQGITELYNKGNYIFSNQNKRPWQRFQ